MYILIANIILHFKIENNEIPQMESVNTNWFQIVGFQTIKLGFTGIRNMYAERQVRYYKIK